MKIKNQVCSLELSKELKQLGVKQDSYWYRNEKNKYKIDNHKQWISEKGKHTKSYSAFTVAELGEKLPDKYISNKIDHHIKFPWNIYNIQIEQYFLKIGDCKTEANVRAKMLIYLLKERLI